MLFENWLHLFTLVKLNCSFLKNNKIFLLEIVLIVLGVPLGFGILILLCLACNRMCDRGGFHRLEEEEEHIINELNQNRFGKKLYKKLKNIYIRTYF